MANLASLPTELMEGVAYNLGSGDVLNLRETCRAAAAGTFRLFQGYLFTTRLVMLERQSMQNLIEISRHPVLRKAVKEVELCVHHLIEPEVYKRLASTGDNDAEESYKESWKDMTDPSSRKMNIMRLAEALSQLPNCKTVGVGNRRQPWGAVRLARRIGVFSDQSKSESPALRQQVLHERTQSKIHALFCIRAIVSAICWKRIAVKKMYITFGASLRDAACAIPLMLVLPPSLEHAAKQQFTSITTLSILLRPNMRDEDIRQSRQLHTNDPARQRPRSWLADLQGFLDVFTSLSNLSIAVTLFTGYDLPASLYRHMRVRHLQVLNLTDFICTADQLLLMLRNHKSTLSKLVLTSLSLVNGKPALWISVVRALCDDFHLEDLNLSGCIGCVHDWEYDVPNICNCGQCDDDPQENSRSITEAVVAWEKELEKSYEKQQVV
ncbi:F-box domain-containing protein [Colletotrichum asianum]|uniref:F-box domain-containing protein n=1 Tax=Colletotrichum asianum TaxID=702518 RepID=A0A8H3W0R0_9PEZI|nr:F-box domain-containing protein [Colletotrichum asianum]